jgi:hypothetical protein
MWAKRSGAFAAMLLVVGAVLTGCDGIDLAGLFGSDSQAVKGAPVPPAMVRHDTQQLIWQIPQLGKPDEAVWVTWNNGGDPSLDGTVHWIDAVVKLPPADTGRLVAQYHPVASGQQPAVQKILRSELPAGPYLTGPELDKSFSTPTMTTYAFLDQDNNTLVLMTTSGK